MGWCHSVKDDASGDAGEEPIACSDATLSPETTCGQPVCEDEQWLVAIIDLGAVGKDEPAKQPGTLQFAQQQEARIEKR